MTTRKEAYTPRDILSGKLPHDAAGLALWIREEKTGPTSGWRVGAWVRPGLFPQVRDLMMELDDHGAGVFRMVRYTR